MSSEGPDYRRQSSSIDDLIAPFRAAPDASGPAQSAPPRRTRPRRTAGRVVLGTIGVLGELMLTAGALVLLYLGWSLYLNSAIIGSEQTQAAADASESMAAAYREGPVSVDVKKAGAPEKDPNPPANMVAPEHAGFIGNLVVPKFGPLWWKPIGEGITVEDVLNNIGIGHYPGTAMPGQVGNFAIAGHRTSHGDPLYNINQLDVGDSMYIEVTDGWYRYVFRSHEYVMPSAVDTVAPVPHFPGVAPTDRILTLTSCNPVHSVSERYIAYATYDDWFPRSEGPPPELAAYYPEAA